MCWPRVRVEYGCWPAAWGRATVVWGPYTWTGVGPRNPLVITGCGNATLQVDLPVYGEAPAGVWLVDDQGRTVGSLSLAAALADGGLYRGILDSNAALPPVPTTSATRVFSVVARYGDDTVLSALFGAYRRTCRA